jgi:hypothetical protein
MKKVQHKTESTELFFQFFVKVQYGTLFAEPYFEFGERVWYETFISIDRKRFDTKPLLYENQKKVPPVCPGKESF